MAQVHFRVDDHVKHETDELSVMQTRKPIEDEGRAKRRAALQALSGSWKDARSTQEIIRDIEGHRTRGRAVVL